MTATAEFPAAQLGKYLTDGTHLFCVIDVVPGQAVLLEDVYDGELIWQSTEALAAAAVTPVMPLGAAS